MDLPEEVMLIIFSRLSRLTILTSVIPVCTRWKSIVDLYISFWNKLKISIDCDLFFNKTFFPDAASKNDRDSDWPIKVGEGDLKSVHKVKYVKFSYSDRKSNRPDLLMERVLDSVIRVCDCIVRVKLDQLLVTNSIMKRLGQRYEAIHELEFGINTKYLYAYEELVNFKNLRTFVSGDYLFSENELDYVADNCVHLENLWITHTQKVNEEHFISFLDKRKDTIREIGIGSHVTEKSLCKMKECKNLETILILNARGISDAVFEWFEELDKLRYLSIGTDASAQAFLDWLQSSKILTNLLVLRLQGEYYCGRVPPTWNSVIQQICAKTQHTHHTANGFIEPDLVLIKKDIKESQAHWMFKHCITQRQFYNESDSYYNMSFEVGK